MKKFLILLAIPALAFTLAACSESTETPDVPVSDTPADVPLPETARQEYDERDGRAERDAAQDRDTETSTDQDISGDASENGTVERPQDRPTGRMRPEVMAYRPPFRAIIGDDNRPTVMGKTTAEVTAILGEPMALIRQTAANPEFSREVRVYSPYDEDPTGFYIYFRGGVVVQERMDEFNGLYGSSLLEWFRF